MQRERPCKGRPPLLDAVQMADLSRLLDAALELDATGRRQWLAQLAAPWCRFEPALRAALLDDVQLTLPQVESGGAQPGDRVGAYELIRPLGSGGMAAVWLARRADGVYQRDVALKLPWLPHARPDLEPRFAREREILARLTHPNIARLYDAGFSPQGQPYLALEYVDGVPLDRYCDERRLPLRERLGLFVKVLSAVEYAHANLIIHRDLKPSNILVKSQGEVFLLDFGIAKLLSEGQALETEITQLAGRALTLEYAAPEQIKGEVLTTASDVYALGVILYELLSAARPYQLKRTSRGAMEDSILLSEPVPPSRRTISEAAALQRGSTQQRLARALRGDLDTIVLKALKKAPAQRYATCSAFNEDLARYLRGDVVLARPDGAAYRTLKFAHRHWAALAVAGFFVLTLTVGFVTTAYEARIAQQQRDIAVSEARTSEQVTSYLVSLFDLASPDRSGGKAIDARTLIEQGQKQLLDGLKTPPPLRGRMLTAIGTLQCKIGRYEQCRRNLEDALALERAHPSHEPLTQARLQYQLASAYNLAGRGTEALALLEAARAAFETQPSADAHQLRGIWYQTGLADIWLNRWTDAHVALDKARELFKDAHGNDTLESADVLGKLAVVYVYAAERPADALELASKRLKLVSAAYGKDDLRYFDALNDYAEVANSTEQFDQAATAWQQAIGGYAALTGRGSEKTLSAQISLGDVYHRQDRRREAIDWFRRTAEDARALDSRDTMLYTSALTALSSSLVLRGDYKEAESAAREAFEIRRRVGTFSPFDLAVTRILWAHALALSGAPQRALDLLQAEMPAVESQQAAAWAGQRLSFTGDCLSAMGRLALAESSYDAALIYLRSQGWNSRSLALNLIIEAKARLLSNENRHREAVPLYRSVLQAYSQNYGAGSPLLAGVKVELAASLLALSQAAEAHALLNGAAELIERELAPTHPARVMLVHLPGPP